MSNDKQVEWMTIAQVCEHLGVSRGTLLNWERTKRLVPARLGGIIRYRRHEVDAIFDPDAAS